MRCCQIQHIAYHTLLTTNWYKVINTLKNSPVSVHTSNYRTTAVLTRRSQVGS